MRAPMKTASSNPSESYLTKNELCDRWKISGMTIWRWCREGKLIPLRLGRGLRFAIADILAVEKAAQIGPQVH